MNNAASFNNDQSGLHIKILNGATYSIIQRPNPQPGQRNYYWLGDNGTEIELKDEEARRLNLS